MRWATVKISNTPRKEKNRGVHVPGKKDQVVDLKFF